MDTGGRIIMFAGFNLETEEMFLEYKALGESLFNENKQQVEREFEKFIREDGSIDGTAMQDNWFPQINADIFISHSHADEEKAIALAGWLKHTFDLNVFIDSCVWGYANNLLKKIDDRYCKNPDGAFYSYEKRNFSTSHVHMMLSTALTMMIDKVECVLFLNTPKSIDTTEVIDKTKSPWIYLEMAMMKLVRKKEPERTMVLIKKGMFEAGEELVVKYKLDMDHLHGINEVNLQTWENAYKNQGQFDDLHPLDILYNNHGLMDNLEIIQESK